MSQAPPSSTLPPNWVAYLSPDGNTYYVNHITGANQWEPPHMPPPPPPALPPPHAPPPLSLPPADAFDISGTSVSSLQNFLAPTPDVTCREALFILLPHCTGLVPSVLEDMLIANGWEVQHIHVAGLVDHELKLAVRMFTVEHPFPLYRSFNNPFNDKGRSPLLLQHHAAYCRLLLRATLCLMQQPQHVYEGPAYRGLKIAHNAELRQKFYDHKTGFPVGSLLTFAAFTSVSLDDKVANGFGDHVLFNFTRVRGVRIRALSAVPQEAEVLVPPPSVFRILTVAMFHGSLMVTLERVDSPLTYLPMSSSPPPFPIPPPAPAAASRPLSDLSVPDVALIVSCKGAAFEGYSAAIVSNSFGGDVIDMLDIDDVTQLMESMGIATNHKLVLKATFASWKKNPNTAFEALTAAKAAAAAKKAQDDAAAAAQKKAAEAAAAKKAQDDAAAAAQKKAAAAAFIAGKPDIIKAAESGDISLVGHHVTAQPSCVNAKDKDGHTALMWSAGHGHLEICKLLVSSKCDANSSDRNGRTALMDSAIGGHLEVCKLLVSSKADLAARNSWGNTALKFAMDYNNSDVVAFLRGIGAPQ